MSMVQKRIVSVVMILIWWMSTPCFGFQLKQFQWGEPKSDIEARLVKDGKTPERGLVPGVVNYHDEYLGHFCKVKLVFTPKSLGLAMLNLEWSDEPLASEVLEILKDRYGDPNVVDIHNFHYEWNGSFSGEKIVLDRHKLSISGGEYYQKYLAEKSSS